MSDITILLPPINSLVFKGDFRGIPSSKAVPMPSELDSVPIALALLFTTLNLSRVLLPYLFPDPPYVSDSASIAFLSLDHPLIDLGSALPAVFGRILALSFDLGTASLILILFDEDEDDMIVPVSVADFLVR